MRAPLQERGCLGRDPPCRAADVEDEDLALRPGQRPRRIGASLALNVGFVALLGLIALAGMIMRNTVILVDQIEADVAGGKHTRHQAIVEATIRRARPVVLTALAAILAMIPLTRSAFWGPMAFVIMGGLFVATFLTLLFLPALYALWFRRSLDGAAESATQREPVGVLSAAD
jgi:hypothetical protein